MAVRDAHVFPGFLTSVLTRLSFQSHRLLFSHASSEVRGENTPVENGHANFNFGKEVDLFWNCFKQSNIGAL